MWHRMDIRPTQGSKLRTMLLLAPSITGQAPPGCRAGTALPSPLRQPCEHVCSLWKQTQVRDTATCCARSYRTMCPSAWNVPLPLRPPGTLSIHLALTCFSSPNSKVQSFFRLLNSPHPKQEESGAPWFPPYPQDPLHTPPRLYHNFRL